MEIAFSERDQACLWESLRSAPLALLRRCAWRPAAHGSGFKPEPWHTTHNVSTTTTTTTINIASTITGISRQDTPAKSPPCSRAAAPVHGRRRPLAHTTLPACDWGPSPQVYAAGKASPEYQNYIDHYAEKVCGITHPHRRIVTFFERGCCPLHYNVAGLGEVCAHFGTISDVDRLNKGGFFFTIDGELIQH